MAAAHCNKRIPPEHKDCYQGEQIRKKVKSKLEFKERLDCLVGVGIAD